MYTLVLIVLILTVILPDLFFYFKLKKKQVKWYYHILNFFPTGFFILSFLIVKFTGRGAQNPDYFHIFMWINFAFMIIYIPKLIYLIFHFLNFLLNLIPGIKTKAFRYAGLFIALSITILMLHGAFINPTNFELNKVELKVMDLPDSFEGYKIIQISDIHLGSWGKNHHYLEPAVEIINQQDADLVLFSGDMVNNFSQETAGWSPVFQKIKAKTGKYAIMGNHDYGDYSDWKSNLDKHKNLSDIKDSISAFGFRILLNESVILTKNADSLVLAGVENWGKPPFPKYGKLNETINPAYNHLKTILISHDPSHWRAEVTGYENIFLTLSGHTHAAQLAFRIGEKIYSPSAWVYDEWNGLYKEKNQYLYINKGLGFVGIPVRIGAARPEITVITLSKAR
jgi:predicted MPP superfamily phosphohydrolase